MKNLKGIQTTERLLQAHFHKPVVEMTQKEVDEYIDSIKNCYTYSTLRTKTTLIKTLFKQYNIEIDVNLTADEMGCVEKGIVTKKELMSMIELLDNDQDKFIMLAVFNGVFGKQGKDLLNLKRKDIDFINKKIHLEDRIITMDDDFARIAKKAMQQESYTILSMDMGSKRITTESYDFSNKTPYAVKVRPYKRNDMGTKPMSYAGFRTRFGDICSMLDLEVTIVSLEKSGYLYKMNIDNVESKVVEIQEWLKNKNIKTDKYLLLRLYKDMKKCYTN